MVEMGTVLCSGGRIRGREADELMHKQILGNDRRTWAGQGSTPRGATLNLRCKWQEETRAGGGEEERHLRAGAQPEMLKHTPRIPNLPNVPPTPIL